LGFIRCTHPRTFVDRFMHHWIAASFDQTKTEPEKDNQKFAYQLAVCQMDDQRELSVEVAFAYYQILERIRDLENHKAKLITLELKQKIALFQESIPPEHRPEFEKYFGSIEIIQDKELSKIYFPIPASCRDVDSNPIIMAEMSSLMVEVNRETPEDKLDDFVERGEKVRRVIELQSDVNRHGWLGVVLYFVSMNEWIWVTCATIFTLLINGVLLCNVAQTHNPDYDWLPVSQYALAKTLGFIHLIFACILLAQYAIGAGNVASHLSVNWKDTVVLKGTSVLELDYFEDQAVWIIRKLDAYLPEIVWKMVFALGDKMALYYTTYVFFSALGLFVNVAFFAFHVLDAVNRISVLGYILKAATDNVAQVGATLLFGILLCYVSAVFAYNQFGWAAYEFGDGGGNWTTLSGAVWQHVDYGFRGPPVFDEAMTPERYIYDILYNILIILIMVAIITGIIIDTFGQMREDQNFIQQDTNNNCFICSLGRETFDKYNIKFSYHQQKEHNTWYYLFYHMYLLGKDDADLNPVEKYLKKQMDNLDIAYFPTKMALCLPREEEDEDDVEKVVSKEISKVLEKIDLQNSKVLERIEALENSVSQRQVAPATTDIEPKSSI